MDFASLDKIIGTSIRALTAVSDMKNITSVPSVANDNADSHVIGLGQMRLHDSLAR